ncbi:MAG: hypothetical protein A3F67_09150 [Verrucomicrobia bacterium RIFCSPHIGHO2_12_FULL_41_10]|nr:MAG: hypothetical protein A3F67_09150 [Verrucomicrobia bacterium RIFCSPHIGHO2_12_FULL_41_10]HLB34575.1 hypothetical protein [Chthoniobacterales bacterium]
MKTFPYLVLVIFLFIALNRSLLLGQDNQELPSNAPRLCMEPSTLEEVSEALLSNPKGLIESRTIPLSLSLPPVSTVHGNRGSFAILSATAHRERGEGEAKDNEGNEMDEGIAIGGTQSLKEVIQAEKEFIKARADHNALEEISTLNSELYLPSKEELDDFPNARVIETDEVDGP